MLLRGTPCSPMGLYAPCWDPIPHMAGLADPLYCLADRLRQRQQVPMTIPTARTMAAMPRARYTIRGVEELEDDLDELGRGAPRT
jgi:hypothetical protein